MNLFQESHVVRNPDVAKFIDRITADIGEGWQSLLGEVFDTHMFYNIIDLLYTKAVENKEKIYPKSTDIFRAFRECKFSTLKVVFIGQDPYHQPGVADGLAFSCGLTMREQPSLKVMIDEVLRTTSSGERNPNLVRWARQGILLLNTALTVKERTPDSHTDIWNPFTIEFLQRLDENAGDLIFVFFGNKAKAYSHLVRNPSNIKMQVTHPASATYNQTKWDSNNLFNNINELLPGLGKEQIIW